VDLVTAGLRSQILLVDNEPPDFARNYITVRFTGDAAVPLMD
jgi:hypothetical protein